MGVTRAQFNHAEFAATAANIATTLTVTAGNLVKVSVKWDTPGGITLTGVQDDLGVNGVLAVTDTEPNDGRGVAIYYFKNHGGGARTFTATFSATTTGRAIEVEELAGASTTAPLGQTSHAFGTGTTSSAGSVTPASDGAYISAYVTLSVAGETTTSPMVSVFDDTTCQTSSSGLEQTTAAAVNPSWTNGTSDNWCAIAAVFLPPATAADTGTAMASIVETDVVSGAKTIVTTLTGETFAPASVPQNPIYVGGQVGGRAGSTSTSSVNFALTGGIDTLPRAGDYVIIEVTVGSAGRNNPQAITTPAGYSAIGQLNSASAAFDTSMNVSRKFMGGTPDTSFTLPSTGNIQDAQRYLVQVWRNVNPTTPDDVTPVSATGAGVTSRPDPGSITPVTAGAVVVILGAGAAGTGANYTAPANYTTDFLTGFTADTNDALIGGGYRTDWTSGAEDPAAFGGGSNTTSDSWAAYTLALRPAPALTPFDDARQARIDGLVSAQSEANGWNAKRSTIPVTAVVRTSDTVCTITLPALASYDITAQETITDTIPGSILAGGNPIVATPTFTVDASGGGGVTVALTGSSGSSALGALAVAVAMGLSGVLGTGGVGTVSANRTIALTGVLATAAVGTVSPNRSFPLSGVSGTGSVGTVTVLANDVTLALTGVQGSSAVGTLAPSRTLATTSVLGTATVGAVAPSSAIALTGVLGTGAVGAVSPAGPAGVVATVSLGTVTASRSIAPNGVLVSGAVGTLAPSRNVPLTGVVGAASVGTVTVSAGANLTLTLSGVAGIGSVGTVTALSSNLTLALTGVAATGSLGAVLPSRSVAVSDTAGTTAVGTVTTSQGFSYALTGVAGTATAGTVTENSAISLSGASGNGAVGTVSATIADATVALTGVAASGAAGTVGVVGADIPPPGKYKSEHDSALVDLGAAHGFSSEHASALKDLHDAGI